MTEGEREAFTLTFQEHYYWSRAILESFSPRPHILTFLVCFFQPASCCELVVIACAQKRLQKESAAWKKFPEAEVEEHFKIHCINNALDDTQYCVLWEKVISELKSDAEYLKSECEEALVIIFFCSHSLFICAPVILLYITIVLIMRAHSISIK